MVADYAGGVRFRDWQREEVKQGEVWTVGQMDKADAVVVQLTRGEAARCGPGKGCLAEISALFGRLPHFGRPRPRTDRVEQATSVLRWLGDIRIPGRWAMLVGS